jgi:hypothetical protein
MPPMGVITARASHSSRHPRPSREGGRSTRAGLAIRASARPWQVPSASSVVRTHPLVPRQWTGSHNDAWPADALAVASVGHLLTLPVGGPHRPGSARALQARRLGIHLVDIDIDTDITQDAPVTYVAGLLHLCSSDQRSQFDAWTHGRSQRADIVTGALLGTGTRRATPPRTGPPARRYAGTAQPLGGPAQRGVGRACPSRGERKAGDDP